MNLFISGFEALLPNLSSSVRTSMMYPVRNLVYERIKQEGNIVDIDLLNDLNKNGQNMSMKELNKVLLQLEILGLITVRWVGKDKRRIEIAERTLASADSRSP